MTKKIKKKRGAKRPVSPPAVPGRRKENLAFDEQLYESARIADLILFAMLSLQGSGKECIFENLIEECFTLFPKAVSFSEHPRWPDSRKIDRPLRTLRKQKLITGNPRDSFFLTRKGERLAQEVFRKLRQGKLL